MVFCFIIVIIIIIIIIIPFGLVFLLTLPLLLTKKVNFRGLSMVAYTCNPSYLESEDRRTMD
jgi:hypothetical protein